MSVSFTNGGYRAATAVNPSRLAGAWKVRRKPPVVVATATDTEREVEIRVCVNRTCGRQGSRETLAVLAALAPAGVSVNSCGCLGRCGAGPNLAVLPHGTLVGHCGTAAKAAQLLAELCGPEFDPRKNLEAFAIRKRGEEELEKGNAAAAEALLSQAIELQPSGARHIIYKSRAAARLAVGDAAGALEDARKSSEIAPKYPQAYICQGDVYFAMGEWNAAENAYLTAMQFDPSIRRSKSFKARVRKLEEKLVASDIPP